MPLILTWFWGIKLMWKSSMSPFSVLLYWTRSFWFAEFMAFPPRQSKRGGMWLDLPSKWWSAPCLSLHPRWCPRAPPQELQWDGNSKTLSPHVESPHEQRQPTQAVTYPWQYYWNIFPPQIQYQCPGPCQTQHLNVHVGALPLRETERQEFSSFASSLVVHSQLAKIIILREVTVGLWFPFYNWISVYSFIKVLICRGLCGASGSMLLP